MIARIRKGNDFHVAWQIKRGGVAENLENVTDIKLERTIYGITTEHTLFTVSGDTITAEIPAEVQTHYGQYKLTLSYELADTGMSDDDRKCKVAIYAFAIVDPLGPADDLLTVDVASDVSIGFKGDKGLSAYQVWLEDGNVGTEDDYFDYLRQPATDAAASLSTLEQTVSDNEALRVTAEQWRSDAELLRVGAESARNDAEGLRDSAEDDRIAAEGIRDENETDRINAEGDREDAEDLRDQAEVAREEAEGLRQTNTATAIQDAGQATTAANTAAGEANSAATAANTAAGDANDAAEAANTAAGLADTARTELTTDVNTKLGEADDKIEEMNTTLSTYDGRVSQVESDIDQLAGEVSILDSAYHLGTYIINSATTDVIVKAIKKVEFPYNVDNRKFYFNLLYRSQTGIVIYLDEYVDGVSTTIFHNTVAAVTGLNVYYLTTASGFIRLTANFDEITSTTLPNPPSDKTTSFFNAITYSRPESELPKVIQKSFGVFNPGVVLRSGSNDVTNQVISSILSVEMSGDWYGRKFIFTYLAVREGKITARFREEFEDGTTRAVYSSGTAVGIEYNILDPIGTAIFDRTTSSLTYKNNLVFKLVIDNSKLPTPTATTGQILGAPTPSYETFEGMGIANEKIVDGNMPSIRVHNTIADMKESESVLPIQFAGNLPFKLTDKTLPHPENAFSPMWNAIKGINRKPNVETKVLTPPTVVGHNNTSCVLQEIGLDDTFYIAGTADKKGRIYTSTDGGETITEIYDLSNILESNEEPSVVWCIKELPSRELLVAMAVSDLTTTEVKTKLFITSENKTVWNRVTKPDLSEFTLTYYKEVDSEDNITFEVYGRIINGWGYSAWRDYVLLTEYGYSSKGGTSTQPYVKGVGHMVTGKMYLSEDGGATFRAIFDYINPPENIIFTTYPAMHHSHGCFIDQYHLTNGIPRLVGIMGDTNNRLVYSDDLGETWEDNWSSRNGTHQSVSGMATPYGYLTLPDNTIVQNRNGVQLIHRGNKWEGMHSDLVCNFMRPEDYTTFGGTNDIVYVGGNIFQRSPNSPILACYTPETSGRFESGARGGAVISFDGGITWEEIWRDTEVGWLRAIQYAMIWETSDGTIWLTPNALSPTSLDGLALTGRVLKITL